MQYLPRVKIHCWGGLGSQLYALSMFLKLETRFPYRNFVIVFHTGGVSSRTYELSKFIASYKIIDDFVRIESADIANSFSKKSFHRALLDFFKLIFIKTGFLALANDDSQFNKVKPWVFSIRGHYSDISIEDEIINVIYSKLKLLTTSSDLIQVSRKFSIHVRLGDLLTLESKSPTNSLVLREQINKILNIHDLNAIDLFSDSPQLALKQIENDFGFCEISVYKVSPFDTVCCLANSLVLLGTSSKISIWSSIMKLRSETPFNVYLPKNLEVKFMKNIAKLSVGSKIEFY